MRILVTGDVYRHGQQLNIQRLYDQVAHHLAPLGSVECGNEEAMPWLDWLGGYEDRSIPTDGSDLVVAFELPSTWMMTVPWIDVRMHPLRFDGVRWSVRSNVPGVAEVVRGMARFPAKRPSAAEKTVADCCFTCQVPFDASLIYNGRMIQPGDVMPAIMEFAAPLERLLVVPHPADPFDVWGRAILEAVPNAVRAEGTAYDTMARCGRMLTVSSSTGFEAPYFDCIPRFLAEPPAVSDPVDVESAELWAGIVEALAGEPVHA